ncbi:MAG: ABC transporter permease, partial [Simkania negevensis]|nr:ABC transporter permease [Simkania negevensis]
PSSIKDAVSLKELKFQVSFDVQGNKLSGEIPWKGIEIQEAKIETSFSSPPRYSPPWPYLIQNGKEKKICLPENSEQKVAAILPKSFQSNGVRLGDLGYFSYGAQTTSSMQEQRLPLYVAGFYDPGIMAIGAKAILTSPEVVQTINSSSRFFAIDPLMSNGIHVWLEDLNDTKEVVRALKEEFQKTGLLSYFAITPFYEYEFAKDLLFQFQSDKILFTIVGAIILMVACSNIISLLIILVNDKKKEIAILSAMGASKRSIALIFTLCGGIMGLLSTLLGSAFALLTLRHIDKVASFLSFIQGREAFNALFYGNSLPSELSSEALLFILIATPIISLLAGLIPAIRATHFHPSQILRSE